MGHPRKSLEDSSVESNVADGGPAAQCFRGSKISNWAGDNYCNLLAKKVVTFCLSPKNLPEVKLKSFGLI